MIKTKKRGRTKLSEDDRKVLIRFFVEGKYIIKHGGVDASIEKCINILSK